MSEFFARTGAVVAALLVGGAAPGVSVTAPWARATAPGQSEAAVYLHITSAQNDVLQTVQSADGMAMLHRSIAHGGMSDMEDVEALPLPAGRDVALAPGGVHVMLMEMKHPLVAGGQVALTLHFAKAGAVTIVAPVLPIGSRGP